jgi:hypothetical protein
MQDTPQLRKNAGMNATRLLHLLLLAVVLMLAACAAERGAKNLMNSALYDYSAAIRWNDFAGATTFLDPESLAQHSVSALDMKRYEQVQVTGYYVKGTEQVGEHELRQLVEIKLVNRHTQAERSIMDRQHWRFDTRRQRWWLTSGLPDITEPR